MVDIFLVRHGEAAANWGEAPDPGLSPVGRQQALEVRDELESYDGKLQVVSSPLLRAQETAQPLATILRSSITTDEDFCEIPSPVGIDDRQAWLSGFMKQQWSEQDPVISQWRERAWSKLFEFDEHTAVFTHFMIINAICGQLTESLETICCVPDNGSVTQLKLESGALKLVEIGRQLQTTVN
jgi:broad specificity phosphatase PhoE